MVMKPLHQNGKALSHTRIKAEATKRGSEALGGKETGTDPREGTVRTENDPRRDVVVSRTA